MKRTFFIVVVLTFLFSCKKRKLETTMNMPQENTTSRWQPKRVEIVDSPTKKTILEFTYNPSGLVKTLDKQTYYDPYKFPLQHTEYTYVGEQLSTKRMESSVTISEIINGTIKETVNIITTKESFSYKDRKLDTYSYANSDTAIGYYQYFYDTNGEVDYILYKDNSETTLDSIHISFSSPKDGVLGYEMLIYRQRGKEILQEGASPNPMLKGYNSMSRDSVRSLYGPYPGSSHWTYGSIFNGFQREVWKSIFFMLDDYSYPFEGAIAQHRPLFFYLTGNYVDQYEYLLDANDNLTTIYMKNKDLHSGELFLYSTIHLLY